MSGPNSAEPLKPWRFHEAREAIKLLKAAKEDDETLLSLINKWCGDEWTWEKEKEEFAKKLQGWGFDKEDLAPITVAWINTEKGRLKDDLGKIVTPPPTPLSLQEALFVAKSAPEITDAAVLTEAYWDKRRKDLSDRFEGLKPELLSGITAAGLANKIIEAEKEEEKLKLEAAKSAKALSIGDASALVSHAGVPIDKVEEARQSHWKSREADLKRLLEKLDIVAVEECQTWVNKVVEEEKKQEKRKLEAELAVPANLQDLKRELREHLVVLEQLIHEYLTIVHADGAPTAKECHEIAEHLIRQCDNNQANGYAWGNDSEWDSLTLIPEGDQWTSPPAFAHQVLKKLNESSPIPPGMKITVGSGNKAKLNRDALSKAVIGAQFVRSTGGSDDVQNAIKTWSGDTKLPWVDAPEQKKGAPTSHDPRKSELLKLLSLNRAVMLYAWLVRRMLAQETHTLAAQSQLLEIRQNQIEAKAPQPVKEVVKAFRSRLKAELDAALSAWEAGVRENLGKEETASKKESTNKKDEKREEIEAMLEKEVLRKVGYEETSKQLYWKLAVTISSEPSGSRDGDSPPNTPSPDHEKRHEWFTNWIRAARQVFKQNDHTPTVGGLVWEPLVNGNPEVHASAEAPKIQIELDRDQNQVNAPKSVLGRLLYAWMELEAEFCAVQRKSKKISANQLPKERWKTPYDPDDQGSFSLVGSLLREAAAMPMRIVAPIFGLFAFLMILGISNPLKQATRSLGDEITTPPHFFSMLLAFLLLLGSACWLMRVLWRGVERPRGGWHAPVWCVVLAGVVISVLVGIGIRPDHGLWCIAGLLIASIFLVTWAAIKRMSSGFGFEWTGGSIGAIVLVLSLVLLVWPTWNVEKVNGARSGLADATIPELTVPKEDDAPTNAKAVASSELSTIKDSLDDMLAAIELLKKNLGGKSNGDQTETVGANAPAADASQDLNGVKGAITAANEAITAADTAITAAQDLNGVKGAITAANTAITAANTAITAANTAITELDLVLSARTRLLFAAATILFLLAMVLHFHQRAGGSIPELGRPMLYVGSIVAGIWLFWLPLPDADLGGRNDASGHLREVAQYTVTLYGFLITLIGLAVLGVTSFWVATKPTDAPAKRWFWIPVVLAVIGAILYRKGDEIGPIMGIEGQNSEIFGSLFLIAAFAFFLGWLVYRFRGTMCETRWLKVAILMVVGFQSWLWLQGLSHQVLVESRQSGEKIHTDGLAGSAKDEDKEILTNWKEQDPKSVDAAKTWRPPARWWSETALGHLLTKRLVFVPAPEGKENTELPKFYGKVGAAEALWVYGGLLTLLIWGGIVIQRRRVKLYDAQKAANLMEARERLIGEIHKLMDRDLKVRLDQRDAAMNQQIKNAERMAETFLERQVLEFDVAYSGHYEKARARADSDLAAVKERAEQIKRQERMLNGLEKAAAKMESASVKLRDTVWKDKLL